jgi:hypothetical protein
MNFFRDSELGDRIRELGCDGMVLVGLAAQSWQHIMTLSTTVCIVLHHRE